MDDVLKNNNTEKISEFGRRRVRYLNREKYYAAKFNNECGESQEQKHFDEDNELEYSNLGCNNTTYSVNQFDEDDMYEDYNIGFNSTYSVKQLNEQPNQVPEQSNQNKTEEKSKKKSIVSLIKHLFNK